MRTDRMLRGCAVLLVAFLVSCAQPNEQFPAGFAFGGTAWQLGSLGGRSLSKGTAITLEFRDKNFNGYSGCNWYGGDYTVTGMAIHFTDSGSTAQLCPTPVGVMLQEEAYGRLLAETFSYRVTGDSLELLSGGGTALTFTRGVSDLKP